MQQIRTQLPYNADAARAHMQELTEWRYHVRKHPWPILIGAGIIGYLIVPAKRSSSAAPVSQPPAKNGETVAKKSLWGGVAGALATMAIRSATSIAAQQVAGALSGRSASTARPSNVPSKSKHSN
jgi:hypothetical protein